MEYKTPKTEHGVVFRNVVDTIFKYNGWPSVTKDERGVLYAAASSLRLTHGDPAGRNCMFVSFNEGKTWTKPIVVNDSKFDDRDTGICYIGDGKMVMSWFTETEREDFYEKMQGFTWYHPEDKAITSGYENMLRQLSKEEVDRGIGAFVKTSDDYGVTWSDPVRVPLTSPHGPSVCRDGRLVYMGKEMIEDYIAPAPIVVYTSFDCGKTWEHTGTVPAGDDCTVDMMHEPHIIELPDGRLLGAIRVHGRTSDPFLSIYTTFSDDKGKTWSVPKCIGVDGLPPHLMVHSSGAVLCSYGCRTEGKWAERVAVSHDNGETWSEDYCIDDNIGRQKDLGYPASVELSDGSILTVYYQALPTDDHTSVLYTKWRLD
ncbi:MAG: exo-alpha-sialidase [Clostridia bacterium]|nr:exo-alpha-sialidase [Clostridia bacterium]